jgi:hypothetical protein
MHIGNFAKIATPFLCIASFWPIFCIVHAKGIPFVYLRNLEHGIQTFPMMKVIYQFKWLPALPGNGFALPRLAVKVRCGSVLDGGLLFGQVRGVHERLIDHLLAAEDTSDRLVVGILR